MLRKWILIFSLVLALSLVWAQGFEDFTNSNATSGYTNGDFVGNNNITWTYVASRDDNGDANGSGIVTPALMLRRVADNSAVSSSTISGGIGNFSVKLYKGFTGGGNRQVELFINGVSKGTSATFDDLDEHLFEVNGINVAGDITIEIKNITSRQVIVDDITWTASDTSGPSLAVVPTVLSGFSYEESNGPSAEQSFSISGSNLDGNVSITAPTNYAISLNSGSGFGTSLAINHVAGTVEATTVYVRMIAGLSAGLYNDETISITAGTVNPQSVTLSGSVIISLPAEDYLVNFDGDGEEKTSYASGTVNLSGLNWDLTETVIGISTSDFLNGIRSARLRGYGSSSMTMLQDKAGGLGILSFQYRRYGTDAQVEWKVEYSIDAGSNWVQIGPAFTGTADVQTFTEMANVDGNVRIKISRTELTGTSNRRLNIDDILLTNYNPGAATPTIYATGNVDPLTNILGNPGEEIGFYHLSSADLVANIAVVAPQYFEIATAAEGPWSSSLSLDSAFNADIYVRMNSDTIGEHSGDITHNSPGATEVSVRVDGETFDAGGVISVTQNLLPFNQEPGTPSAVQSYTLQGTGLLGPITVNAEAPFELSADGSTGWATSLDFAVNYNGLVYIRMNADAAGTYDDRTIEHLNLNATPNTFMVSGTATPPVGEVANLFFSEYIEGLSNNKALEIFNAESSPIDLSNYIVELYGNGASTPGNTLALTGILAAGDMYVIANSNAAQEILDVADITSTVTYFNGNDAVVLRCINPDVIIDVIGEVGVDPGNNRGWSVAGVADATKDHTLIRKSTVGQGNLNWAAQAGTDVNDSEWIVMPVGHHTDLGTHTFNPGGNVAAAPSFDPPAGTYLTAINVTLSSTTPGATIRYTTDGSDPSSTLGTIYSTPIAVSASTTIKAIAYATGYDPSFISAAVYAMPAPISTIAQLRTQPTGTSHVYTLTGEAVLTYKNAFRNLKYIQDATAAILIDDFTNKITTDYNLYDGITGITGSLNVYNGMLQFVPVADPGAASSVNNTVVPEVRTLASLTNADQGKLIKVQNATITSTTLTDFPATAANLDVADATASAILRTFVGTDYANTPIPADAVNLTCLVGQFGTTMQVSPRFLSDIQAAGGTLGTPVVTIIRSGNNVDLSWTAITGASSYRIESSDDPYGTFTQVGSPTANTTISIPATPAKKFFKVIAIQ